MESLAPVTGLLFASAITPGPNNLIVLEAGTRRSLSASASAIVGVVAGSLVLLALVWNGVGAAIQAFPALSVALSVAGGLYLGWLGLTLVRTRTKGDVPDGEAVLPTSMMGIAAFQLANPKAWVLVATASAALVGTADAATLAILIAGVTIPCLALWAFAGAALSRLLARPAARRGFNLAMGGLLAVSAAGVIIDAFV